MGEGNVTMRKKLPGREEMNFQDIARPDFPNIIMVMRWQ